MLKQIIKASDGEKISCQALIRDQTAGRKLRRRFFILLIQKLCDNKKHG